MHYWRRSFKFGFISNGIPLLPYCKRQLTTTGDNLTEFTSSEFFYYLPDFFEATTMVKTSRSELSCSVQQQTWSKRESLHRIADTQTKSVDTPLSRIL